MVHACGSINEVVGCILESFCKLTEYILLTSQMDTVFGEAIKMMHANNGKMVKEDEFKKLVVEILGSIMLQLQGNPISVRTNSVVHEPISSSSSLLQASS